MMTVCSTCHAARRHGAIVMWENERFEPALRHASKASPTSTTGRIPIWTCGNFAVSEWTLTGTRKNGGSIEVRGVDLLEFRAGKVTRKDSFWKLLDYTSYP